MATAIGLTAEGRLSATRAAEEAVSPASEPAVEPVADGAAEEPALASLQDFVSGRQRVLSTSLEEIELRLVRLALERSGGNVTAAAQMLGMSRAQVSYRLKGG